MPELPEVETIRRALKQKIVGKTIGDIRILSPKNFIGSKNSAINQKIISIERYGKVLGIKLENGKYLNIHFKLSGQMLYAHNSKKAFFENVIPFTGGRTMPGKTTRVILKFKDGGALYFNDLRKFGWIKLESYPMIPKGVDVMSAKFTNNYLGDVLTKTRRPVKVALMDQDKITGIGNIYANDSLFLAHVHPQRSSNSLTKSEVKKLHLAIIREIKKGIRDKGSSGADEAFILPDGSRGRHQRNFLVYQRDKKPCIKCNAIIRRIKHNGRSSFFCPECQK